MKMEAIGYIILTVKYSQEGKSWTAECLELGTASFGDSFEEAKEAISEAIGLHLNGLEEVGERKHFFKKHGIRLYSVKPPQRQSIQVPLRNNTFYQPVIQPVLQAASV